MKKSSVGKKGGRARKALLGGVLLSFCLCIFAAPVDAKPAPEAEVPQYQLKVSFDIPKSKVMGEATIISRKGGRFNLYLDELEVHTIRVNGRPLNLRKLPNPAELEVAGGVVEIIYEGVFKDPEGSIIDERGVILRDMWYPLVAGPCRYTLTATLPRDYEALSEADQITKSLEEGTATFRFVFPHPLPEADGLTFAAFPRLQVFRTSYRGIEIAAYFSPEHAGLASLYVEQAGKFLEMYERLLGPYPYRRLAIVESFQPSAYSMPTYILIGREELEVDDWGIATLAHEILHQWFGNSVFTDFDRGNWNEGLTIYLADHFLEEQKGKGWQCRRRILSNFKSLVDVRNEIPLRKFSEREDDVTRSVGYGKSAMVFHMLRRFAGEEAFFAAIRDFVQQHSFRVASWSDLQKPLKNGQGKNCPGSSANG
jgi:aminopeptidase N